MKKKRFSDSIPDGDYKKGYLDGLADAYKDNELSAYYAGVGYGKKAAGDDSIGFNSHEELSQFQHGVASKDKHFNSFRTEPLSWWERLFGGKRDTQKTLKHKNFKQEKKNAAKRARKMKRARKKARKK